MVMFIVIVIITFLHIKGWQTHRHMNKLYETRKITSWSSEAFKNISNNKGRGIEYVRPVS